MKTARYAKASGEKDSWSPTRLKDSARNATKCWRTSNWDCLETNIVCCNIFAKAHASNSSECKKAKTIVLQATAGNATNSTSKTMANIFHQQFISNPRYRINLLRAIPGSPAQSLTNQRPASWISAKAISIPLAEHNLIINRLPINSTSNKINMRSNCDPQFWLQELHQKNPIVFCRRQHTDALASFRTWNS